jgi:transcription antitermination factor NusG
MAKLENVKVIDMIDGKVARIQYNGKVYERVSVKANAGDLVLVENEDDAEWICDVESGAFYELYEDEYGDLVFKDDDDSDRDYSNWYDELVLFRATETSDKDIEKRVAELERRLSAIERQSERLKIGDYARVVGDTFYNYITENQIVGIASDLDEDGLHKIELPDGSGYDYARPSSLEKYTEHIDQVERSKFKKGDKVRVVSGGDKFPLYGFYDGEVYEVDDNNYEHYEGPYNKLIRIVDKDGGHGYARPDQLERVDFEELKFAEIGRKPGEFKKGDIVRVIDSCAGRLIKGGLYEINGHEGSTEYVTLDGEKWLAEFELVAPVESRVDLD